MRRLRVIGLGIVVACLLVGSTADHGQAGQSRAALGVTVRVVAACSATSTTIAAAGCPKASTPVAIVTEAAAPDAAADGTYTAETAASSDAVRYLTLIY